MSNCFILKFGLVECHFVTAHSCLLTMVLSCALEKKFFACQVNQPFASVFSIGMLFILFWHFLKSVREISGMVLWLDVWQKLKITIHRQLIHWLRVNSAMILLYVVNLPLKYPQRSFTKLCLLAEDVGSAVKSVVNVSWGQYPEELAYWSSHWSALLSAWHKHARFPER